MLSYPGNDAHSATPREAEHVNGSSHGTQPMGQDRLRCMAPSLHLSQTEAQYLTLQLATGVTWPDIYDTLQQKAQLAAPPLKAGHGSGSIIYDAACSLPALVRHLCDRRPIRPVDLQ